MQSVQQSIPLRVDVSANEMDTAGFGDGVDDCRIVEQPRLKVARRFARGRIGLEAVAFGDGGNLLRRSAREQLALAQHKDPIAALGFVEIGRAHQDGKALLADQARDDLPQFAARQRIDADRRLVKQQHLGRADQRAGKTEFLLHAAGQIAGEALRKPGEVGHLQQLGIAAVAFLLTDAVQAGVEVEILLDAKVLVEPEPLRHIGDAILDLLRLARHVDAVDNQCPGVRPHQAGDEPDQRGLAGAVGADQSGECTARHLDRHIVERDDDVAGLAPKLLAQIPADDGQTVGLRRGHGRLSAAEPAGGAASCASGSVTVAGMPRRKSSFGSLTKTRTS